MDKTGKEILVIGAGGYIGGRLSYLLAKQGYKVTAVTYPNIPHDAKWISLMKEVILGDISTPDTINKITDNRFDTAIHLVSLDQNDSNKDPNYVSSINVMPVWNLLESFKQKNTLNQFIYFSTIHVYGDLPLKIITEDFMPKPKNPYGLTHLMAESICNMYHHNSDINTINIRMSNSYGSPYFKDNSCWWLVVNDLCRTAFYQNKIVLKSDGSALRDFIHYKDIFQAVELLVKNKQKSNYNTFNLSSGKTFSIKLLAETVKNVFYKRYGIAIPIEYPENVTFKKTNDKKYIISNKRLKSIGFVPIIDIEQGINELFEYFENNE